MTTAPQSEAIRRYAASAGLADVGDSCDTHLLADRAEFWRIVADRGSYETAAKDKVVSDLRRANLTQQISCTPTDGLAWAELASIEQTERGWSDKVLHYLSLSQRYAPYEGPALTTRLDVLSRSEEPQASDLLRRDLIAVLEYASPREAAIQMEHLNPRARAWAEDYLSTLETFRSDAIRKVMRDLTTQKVN